MTLDHKGQAYLALAALCIIWSTTYTVIKIGVQYFPPYMMVAMRQTTAGVILLLLAWIAGKFEWPGRKYVFFQALTGLATITGGNGFITWGMQYVSSGLAAIIGALTPVIVLLINYIWHGRDDRFSPYTIAGVLLGFAGLGFIFYEGWADILRPEYRLGLLGCFASCLTWSMGTVMSKKFNSQQVSPLMNAGMQIFAGGLGGWVLSFFLDTTHHIDAPWQGWAAMAYLIVVGSSLAFTLYMFMLKHLSATAASLYTYINPVLALLLGAAFLNEKLQLATLVGAAITLVGIWLVNKGEGKS